MDNSAEKELGKKYSRKANKIQRDVPGTQAFGNNSKEALCFLISDLVSTSLKEKYIAICPLEWRKGRKEFYCCISNTIFYSF